MTELPELNSMNIPSTLTIQSVITDDVALSVTISTILKRVNISQSSYLTTIKPDQKSGILNCPQEAVGKCCVCTADSVYTSHSWVEHEFVRIATEDDIAAFRILDRLSPAWGDVQIYK